MAVALTVAVSPLAALTTTTVTNSAPVVVADGSEVVSNLTVAGIAGNITDLSITLNGLSHTNPDDLVFGLVNQTTGLGFVFFSGAGGSTDVVNATLTFSGAGTSQLPESFVGGGITSGTYLPSNFSGYEFTTASGFTNAASLASYVGSNANAVWSLYVDDIFTADTGALAGGWSLTFTTDPVTGGVPEPMTWALMLVGFGFTGATLRRRRDTTATVAA